MKLDKEEQFYNIKLETIKNERWSSLEFTEKIDRNKKKNKKRKNLIDYTERKQEVLTNQKIKSLIDFDREFLLVLNRLLFKKTEK